MEDFEANKTLIRQKNIVEESIEQICNRFWCCMHRHLDGREIE